MPSFGCSVTLTTSSWEMSLFAVCKGTQQSLTSPHSVASLLDPAVNIAVSCGTLGGTQAPQGDHQRLTHLGCKLHVEFSQEHCHSCWDVDLCQLLPQAIPADTIRALFPQRLQI